MAGLKISFGITLFAAFFLGVAPAFADSAPGQIVGDIDGIYQDGDQCFIAGWAGQQGLKNSIAVQVFATDPSDSSKKTFLAIQWANFYCEPAVNRECRDNEGGMHRFMIMLPYGYGPENIFWIYGIRQINGVPNSALGGSGARLRVLPKLSMPYPPLPSMSGSYRSLAIHPRVFMTSSELQDLVVRINKAGAYSQQRFNQLADQIKRDLASGINWDMTYSGNNGWVYTYAFSYEPQDHHEKEIRSFLHAAANANYPKGAAIVASRLALYAALVKIGAVPPPAAPSADEAGKLAKRILLAWADHGFPRDGQGRFLSIKFVSGDDQPHIVLGASVPALSVGRGVLYSVQAQDLLESFGALNADEERRLNAFHRAMYDLLRESDNAHFAGFVFPNQLNSRYSNVVANALASLLATARLLDDSRRFNAVLNGGDPSTPLLLPWVRFFDRAIYGQDDTPSPSVPNQFPDSLTSLKHETDFWTPTVAPGEIADRIRNAHPGQGIGYPMFTLERLIDSAEILRIAGFDPYGYRGRHRQSIEMALEYYACFAKSAGFLGIVTEENSSSLPNAAQYYGKVVNGVDQLIPIGALRFPDNATITSLESAAKTASATGGFSLDAILFGKWRD